MAIEGCMLHNGFYGMGYGWIFQIVIFVLFFMIVWWLIKGQGQYQQKRAAEKSPQEILKLRLAKGEITKKEYESLKKELLN